MSKRKCISIFIAMMLSFVNTKGFGVSYALATSGQVANIRNEDFCKIESSQEIANSNLDGAIKLSCLEILLKSATAQSLTSDSKTFQIYSSIVGSNADVAIKLNSVLVMASHLKKFGLDDELGLVANGLEQLLQRSGSFCSRSFSKCDLLIHTLLGVAHIFPQLVNRGATKLASNLPKSNGDILSQAIELKIKASILLSEFYQAVQLSRNGTKAIWKIRQPERVQLIEKISSVSKDLVSFSQVWSANDLKEFLPREILEKYKTKINSSELLEISRLFNQNLQSTGAVLAAVVKYSNVINGMPQKQWHRINLDLCANDQRSCYYYLLALITFLDNEISMPSRDEYLGALQEVYDKYYNQPSIKQVLEYAKANKNSVDEFLKKTSSASLLEGLDRYESRVSVIYPDFNSLFFQVSQLMGYATQVEFLASEYKKAQSENNKSSYEAAIQKYEKKWFYLKCVYSSFSQSIQPEIELPLSKIKLSTNTCMTQRNLEAYFNDNFDREMLRLWTEEPIRKGLIKIGIIGTTIASALIAGPGSAAITAFLVKRFAVTATGSVLTALSIKATQAMIGSLIFTSSMKVLNASLGISPFWNPHEGIYGNFVKPWLIGSAIFFVLPYTAIISSKMASLFLKNVRSQNVVQISTFGIGLTVDTFTFANIEITHRLFEKLFGDRKLIFNGDADKVAFDNFIYALAFQVTGAFHRNGIYINDIMKN